jgi:hypothetical protein
MSPNVANPRVPDTPSSATPPKSVAGAVTVATETTKTPGALEEALRLLRSPAFRLAVGLAVGAHVIVFTLLRPVFVAQQFRETPPALTVSAAGWHEDLRTQADIANAEPLYLSTPRNYGNDSGVTTAPRIEDELVASPLGQFVPELSVRVGSPLPLDAQSKAMLPTSPHNASLQMQNAVLQNAAPHIRWPGGVDLSRLLPLNHWNVATTFGLRPQPGPNAPAPRQAWMRVEHTSTGEVVVQRSGVPFEEEALLELPPAVSGSNWRPAAFSVLVDLQGVVGEAIALPWIEGVSGTDNAAVDAAIRKFLATEARLSSRLAPGHYRVIIGP